MSKESKKPKIFPFWREVVRLLIGHGFRPLDNIEAMLALQPLAHQNIPELRNYAATKVLHMAKDGDHWHLAINMSSSETKSRIDYIILIGLAFKPVSEILHWLQRPGNDHPLIQQHLGTVLSANCRLEPKSTEEEMLSAASHAVSVLLKDAKTGVSKFDPVSYTEQLLSLPPGISSADQIAFLLYENKFQEALQFVERIESGQCPNIKIIDAAYRTEILHSLPTTGYIDAEFLCRARKICDNKSLEFA